MGTPKGDCGGAKDGTVSLTAEVPATLLEAMRTFIDHHPNWDQYRLVQAALAGFLVQHGSQDRAVTRCYLANLFPGHRGFDSIPGPASAAWRSDAGSREAA
ncbi:MAG: DUF2811 domain-containing protein [Cyanobacteriota bacterium]|nr:DUF2811 domain-containing protein [Cyanobacteriota bacterium]